MIYKFQAKDSGWSLGAEKFEEGSLKFTEVENAPKTILKKSTCLILKQEHFTIDSMVHLYMVDFQSIPEVIVLTYDSIFYINYVLNSYFAKSFEIREEADLKSDEPYPSCSTKFFDILAEKITFICDRTRKYLPEYDSGFSFYENGEKQWNINRTNDLIKMLPAVYKNDDKENMISPPMKRLRVEEDVLKPSMSQ